MLPGVRQGVGNSLVTKARGGLFSLVVVVVMGKGGLISKHLLIVQTHLCWALTSEPDSAAELFSTLR